MEHMLCLQKAYKLNPQPLLVKDLHQLVSVAVPEGSKALCFAGRVENDFYLSPECACKSEHLTLAMMDQ